jgi:spoIIIJ-associated protein
MDRDAIKTLISDLLSRMDAQVSDIEVIEGDVHPIFLVRTSDSGVLIGNGGETLKALNHIIKKIVEKRHGKDTKALQFLLDVNGYHRKRIQELKNQAMILGGRAKMFKSNVEMNPMNAYERMIIHMTFANDPQIVTESEGEGKMRRVVLKYQEKREEGVIPDSENFS